MPFSPKELPPPILSGHGDYHECGIVLQSLRCEGSQITQQDSLEALRRQIPVLDNQTNQSSFTELFTGRIESFGYSIRHQYQTVTGFEANVRFLINGFRE